MTHKSTTHCSSAAQLAGVRHIQSLTHTQTHFYNRMPAELTVSGLGEKGERREDESSDCLTVLQMFGIICVPADETIINPD